MSERTVIVTNRKSQKGQNNRHNGAPYKAGSTKMVGICSINDK